MRSHGQFRGRSAAAFFSAPQLIIVAIFFYYPAWIAIRYSLTLQKPFGGDALFVGLDNFWSLFEGGDFIDTLGISLAFSACATIFSMLVGLILAALVHNRSAVAQNLLIWPFAVAAPVAGVILQLLFDPTLGFGRIHSGWQPGIDSGDAFLQIVISFAWIHVPLNFVIILAGLKSIPQSLVDAASIDGASRWRIFRDLQLPLLRPHTFLLLVIGLAESLTQSFGIVHTMTQGGPAGATNILVYKIYSDGFEGMDLSGSATQSVVLMLIVILLTAAQFRYLDNKIEYRR